MVPARAVVALGRVTIAPRDVRGLFVALPAMSRAITSAQKPNVIGDVRGTMWCSDPRICEEICEVGTPAADVHGQPPARLIGWARNLAWLYGGYVNM